jgi:hypothetical protein
MLDNLYCTQNVDIKMNCYVKAVSGKRIKTDCCNCGHDEYKTNAQFAQS